MSPVAPVRLRGLAGVGLALILSTALPASPALSAVSASSAPAIALVRSAALLQMANPANAHPVAADSAQVSGGEHRSWRLPEIVVEGERPARLREEQRIGSYLQPRWTATRRFPTTRVYVIPEGKAEFEWWIRPTWKDDGVVEMRTLWEMEFGLPYRFQLDLYLRSDQILDPGGEAAELGQQIEVRWAWADWGKIWGNPTFYLEWVNEYDSPDKVEPKLLLGGQLGEGWHAGLNFVAELEMGGEREYEYEITSGIARTIRDSKVSLGAELRYAIADVASDRGNYATNVRLGPSLQLRPIPPMTINFAPLFGLTDESDNAQLFVNTGWEF